MLLENEKTYLQQKKSVTQNVNIILDVDDVLVENTQHEL